MRFRSEKNVLSITKIKPKVVFRTLKKSPKLNIISKEGLSVKFHKPLQEGLFIKRYKRFFADISFNGKIITAHCPNTGSMKGCQPPQASCFFSTSDNPKRKLPYTLEMIKTSTSWVGVNTALPNKLTYEAWQNQVVNHWNSFDQAQLEVKINSTTRLDLALWKSTENSTEKIKFQDSDFFSASSPKFHFIEIKNVSLVEEGRACFPDAVTLRGQKHLKELTKLIQSGHTGEIFFVVQRHDAKEFSPADHIDSEYGRLLREGQEQGLKISAYPCHLSSTEIKIQPSPLKIIL